MDVTIQSSDSKLINSGQDQFGFIKTESLFQEEQEALSFVEEQKALSFVLILELNFSSLFI